MNVARLAGAAIVAGDQSALAAGVEYVRVGRTRRDVAALAAAHGIHFGIARACLRALHTNGAVVLLRTAGLIRKVFRRRDVVELRGGIIFLGPRRSTVHRDISAAIVRIDHALRIVGIDPKVVIIAVLRPNRAVDLAGVGRFVEAGVQNIKRVAIFRISEDMRVIERALTQPSVLAHFSPGRTGIIRTEHATVFVLHQRVDPI